MDESVEKIEPEKNEHRKVQVEYQEERTEIAEEKFEDHEKSLECKKFEMQEENNGLEEYELATDTSNITTIAFYGILVAVIYSLSFSGIRVYPQLSFFVFCAVVVTILYVVLKKLNWLACPRAFVWGVPLILISGFNMIFDRSVFTYLNVVAAWGLFAFIILGSLHGNKYPFGNLFFWKNVAKATIGNMKAGIYILIATSKFYKVTKNHVALRFFLGIVLALPVAIIIFGLMLSADLVFSALISDILQNFDFNLPRFFWHIIVILVASIFVTGYVYNAKFMKRSESPFCPLNLDKVIALAFLLVLNLLFLAFCYIQFAYLFTGGINTLPAGLTYAEYARQGFFQLLFITIINFVVIIVFLQVFPNHSKKGVIRIMLVMLTIFTGVLIASSFYRMNLYMDVFGFSPLRMAVITFLVMESLFCIATLTAMFINKLDLMKFYIVTGMIFFIIGNFTGTGWLSTSLNVNKYVSDANFSFNVSDHFLGADSAGDLIKLYYFTDNTLLQEDIRRRLTSIRASYVNEPWQNRSVIKRVNLRHIEVFLE